MPRLQDEIERLYRSTARDDGADTTRVLVLELMQPAGWDALSMVWQGVQADLNLPAPAIAANGEDGLQLWFSWQTAISTEQAHAFGLAVCRRYLQDMSVTLLRLLDGSEAAPIPQVPALKPATGNWSAFIAPDLAALFAETPWLDVSPGDGAQAHLLSTLGSISATGFDQAKMLLRCEDETPAHTRVPATALTPTLNFEAVGGMADPYRFLLAVMQDERVELALRIEAARALLPYSQPTDPT